MDSMTGKYEAIFSPDHDTALIRITEGKFANFVYQYGNVKLGDPKTDSEAETFLLAFDYTLHEAPESYELENEEEEQKEFEQIIGDILYDIIVNSDKVKESSASNNTK